MHFAVLLLLLLVMVPVVQDSIVKLDALMEPPPTAEEICADHPEWTRHDCLRIASRAIWLGMTDNMARASLGDPIAIHRSNGEWGVYEEWVYKTGYLYFENGVLTKCERPDMR